MSDLVGEQIGNYRVTALIKRGGMGAVYIAEHPEIGRKVAIKIMHAALDDDSSDAERFLYEARATANIDHPNVVEIYDFGRLADGRPYHIMELLRGRELEELIQQRGAMPALEVLPYVQQICAGLQAAHNVGVVHRDLKPENVFELSRRPLTIKVLDFGIAKTQTWPGTTLTSTGKIIGTPLVIAPEQASCENTISPRTDIYSLGVTLFWMLAGQPPFAQDAPVVLVARHILTKPPPLLELAPTVPAGVARLVDQCLEKAPEDRPTSASEVSARFSQALGQPPWEHQLAVVPWDDVKGLVLVPSAELQSLTESQLRPPQPSPDGKRVTTPLGSAETVQAPGESLSSTAETVAVGTGETASAGGGTTAETSLDVPGLGPEFQQPPQVDPGEQLEWAQEPALAAPPAHRWWLLLPAVVLLLSATAVAVYLLAGDPRPTPVPDAGPAAVDAGTPDAVASDQRPSPDLGRDRGVDRKQQPDRRIKRPRPVRKDSTRPRPRPAKLPLCSESNRVGEGTMDPFGTRCRKK